MKYQTIHDIVSNNIKTVMPARGALVLSWEDTVNGGGRYTISVTDNASGESIITRHGATAAASVTSTDVKTKEEPAPTQKQTSEPTDTAQNEDKSTESSEDDDDDDVM